MFAEIEDTSRIARNSADSKTLIINLVPVALTTNTFYRVKSSDTTADSIVENFIDSTSNHTVTSCSLSVADGARASTSLGIEGTISSAFCASSVDSEV